MTVIDTRTVPVADRIDYWAETIAGSVFPVQVDHLIEPSFVALLKSAELGAVAVRSIQGPPHRATRTSQMISASDPECILVYILTRGAAQIEQDGRQCLLRPGDLACHDSSRASTFEGTAPFGVHIFTFPKWFIGPGVERISQRTATKVSHTASDYVARTARFMTGISQSALEGKMNSQLEAASAAEMLLPFIRKVFVGTDVDTESESILGSSLLTRIQQYALAHLDDRNLGPESIADAHYISTRYVYKLFEPTGLGASAWIREKRLERAADELRTFPTATIAEIATRWGYDNPASFSRAFRQKFGFPPMSLR